jgi:hypothetical protein
MDTFCNIAVDYAQLMAQAVLPFRIALDLEHSNLLPAPGERQRFCYTVTQAGDGPFPELRHLVLGVCGRITAEELGAVTISPGGESRTAGVGRNVELVNLDPQTGCCGLKFSFGPGWSGGDMKLSFELSTPYPVGPVPVSLFGDATSAGGLSICGPVCG